MGHLVGDRAVHLVSDPGHHGHVQGGDGPRQDFGVEGRQVGSRTATPDQGDDIRLVGGDHVQGLGQVDRRSVSLNPGIALEDREREPATRDFFAEVGVGGGSDAGNQADAQRRHRNGVGPVGPQQAFVGQGMEKSLAFCGEAPEGERGVDTVHDELQATTGWIEVEAGPDS